MRRGRPVFNIGYLNKRIYSVFKIKRQIIANRLRRRRKIRSGGFLNGDFCGYAVTEGFYMFKISRNGIAGINGNIVNGDLNSAPAAAVKMQRQFKAF